MANDAWRSTTLGDVLELKRGYDLPSRDRRDGPYPIVSSSGVSGYHAQAMAKAPGVVTGRYGTIGQVFYITQDFWPLNTSLYVRDFKGNDPRFVSYFLRTLNFLAYSDKAAVPGLNRNHLHMAEVTIPPVPEQKAIAAVLGALDDKVEMNRKQARVLEGIARAVFKSWFVDFDPVRSVAAGEPISLPANVAALFPKRLVDSPIGEIPKGWTPGTVGDIADASREGVDPSDVDSRTPYVGLEHMPRRSIVLTEWAHAEKATSGKSMFRRGQILFGKLRPYFHKVAVAPVDGVCSTDIIVAKPKKPCWAALALGHLSSDALVQHADRSSSGTKMPRTNWRDLAAFQIAIPPEALAELASSTCAPMLDRLAAGTHQGRTLAALRDALLPRLISGELRIADAERIVGRAV